MSTGVGEKRGDRRKSKYSTSSDGRVIINDSDGDDIVVASKQTPVDYYKLSQEGESAFMRLPDGRIKFEKESSKRKRGFETKDADDEDEDVEMQNAGFLSARKRNRGRLNKEGKGRPLGAEYRAKRAGGDIKRKGKPDPFAYVPLNRKSVGKR